MNAKEMLTRKVGPLPVYGWIIGVGGGLILAVWIRRAYGGGSDVAESATDGTADYVYPSEGSGGAALSEPGYTGTGWPTDDYTDDEPAPPTRVEVVVKQPGKQQPAQPSRPATQAPDKPDTNGEWRTMGVSRRVKAGWNREVARNALQRFLDGKDLTPQQRHVVNETIADIGAPPRTPAKVSGNRPAANGGGGAGGGGGQNGAGKPKPEPKKPAPKPAPKPEPKKPKGRRDVGASINPSSVRRDR